MDAVQPRFQIGENEVDDGQKVVGNLGIATRCSRSDGVLDKPTKRRGASVRHDGEPDATGIASVPSLLLRGPRFAMTHLDAAGDENLVVDATPFAARPAADVGFVHLDMLTHPE